MKKADELKVLDMCCGSGCIGISIATSKKLKDVSVVLCDISDEALTIAKEVANNAGAKNVQIIKSDLFENISSQFDMIICNPPYIKSEDLENLEKEVRNYDPKIALDGGIDGLKFYRQIVALAPKYLNDGGLLVFEIGLGEGEKVSKMLSADFENILVMKDYCGIERYIIAKKK